MTAAKNSNNGGCNTNANKSNNGGGGCNTRKFNNKKKGGRKGSRKRNGASKEKGFNRNFFDGVLKNIVISSNKGIPIAGQYKKFIKNAQTYADNNGLSHVAACIKKLTDKDDDLFKEKKADISNCVQ